jgi:hypothetical protein
LVLSVVLFMVMTTSFEAIISDRPDDSKAKSVIRPDQAGTRNPPEL